MVTYQVCSLLHQRYSDFGPALILNLTKSLAREAGGTLVKEKPGVNRLLACINNFFDFNGQRHKFFSVTLASKISTHVIEVDKTAARRKRGQLRLLAELVLVGVTDAAPLILVVQQLVRFGAQFALSCFCKTVLNTHWSKI